MRIDHEGIKPLPKEATHIYIAILHPEIQKEIKRYEELIENVYVEHTRIYIPRRDGRYDCLLLVTY